MNIALNIKCCLEILPANVVYGLTWALAQVPKQSKRGTNWLVGWMFDCMIDLTFLTDDYLTSVGIKTASSTKNIKDIGDQVIKPISIFCWWFNPVPPISVSMFIMAIWLIYVSWSGVQLLWGNILILLTYWFD